jgi:hypothetical protein
VGTAAGWVNAVNGEVSRAAQQIAKDRGRRSLRGFLMAGMVDFLFT